MTCKKNFSKHILRNKIKTLSMSSGKKKRPHYKNSYKSPNKKEEDFFIEKNAQQGS